VAVFTTRVAAAARVETDSDERRWVMLTASATASLFRRHLPPWLLPGGGGAGRSSSNRPASDVKPSWKE